jgi:hypothetical protein
MDQYPFGGKIARKGQSNQKRTVIEEPISTTHIKHLENILQGNIA